MDLSYGELKGKGYAMSSDQAMADEGNFLLRSFHLKPFRFSFKQPFTIFNLKARIDANRSLFKEMQFKAS